MKFLSYSFLRPAAEDALGAARYSPKKIILIHTGVTLGMGLLLSILSYVLDLGIAQTGGLSGMQNRALLQGIQALLSVISTVLLPFWEIGYLCAALGFARRQNPEVQTLFGGLRNWGVVLRGLLLKVAVLFAVSFVAVQVVSVIYFMTPWGASMMELSLEMMDAGADPMAMMESEAYMELMMEAVPFMLGGTLLLLLPVLYLLRFMDYVLMDQPELGALYALLSGFRMTRQNWKELLKLDLHFWWYYLLEVLVVVLSWGSFLLELAGIDLGIGAEGAALVCYMVSVAAQLGLYVWMKNKVFTTYALAYDQIYLPAVSITKENV